jgi:hypothetical protein
VIMSWLLLRGPHRVFKWKPTKEFINDALGQRDIVALTNLIRDQDLPPEVRQHLADTIHGLLTKKIKWPRRRPPKKGLYSEKRQVAERVWNLKKARGWQKVSSAISHVAKELKLSERTVWGCWKVFDPAGYEYLLKRVEFDFMMDAGMDERREAAIELLKEEHGEREFTDEEIEDAAYEVDQAWHDASPHHEDY